MPIKHEVAQGEEEWFNLRLGIPTASEFKNIITAKTMVMSKSADAYANLKIAEIMTGEMQGVFEPTYWMQRGSIMEIEARNSYELINDVETQRGGFITTDDGAFGCSPDFLVGNDGMGEIKCLSGKHHVAHLLTDEVKADHIPQIQGQLFVAEREWCDYWMYHPDMPRVGVRTYRDDKFIARLKDCLDQFRDMMNEKIERLQSLDRWQVMPPRTQKPKDDQPTYMAG